MGRIMGEDESYWNECFNDYALIGIFANNRLNKLFFFCFQIRGGGEKLLMCYDLEILCRSIATVIFR